MVVGFDPDAPQVLFPRAVRLFASLVEGQRGGFLLKIQAGVLDRRIRESHFGRNDLSGLRAEVQIEPGSDSARLSDSGFLPVAMKDTERFGFPVQHGRKIERYHCAGLIFLYVFGFGDDPPFDTSLFGIDDPGVPHGAAFALPVPDVEKKMVPVALSEGKALYGYAGRSRQFGPNAVVVQQDGVITCRSDLVPTVETGAVSGLHTVVRTAGNGDEFAAGGHQHDAADLKFMQARKTFDRAVAIIVSGGFPAGFVPQAAIGRGAGFGHPEGHRAGGEVEPPAMGGSDPRFDIRRELFLLRLPGRRTA